MAFTRTATVTKTFPRIDLIKLQVTIALRRARTQRSAIRKIGKGLDRHWIEKVVVYGVERSGTAWCALTVHIDWGRHQIHMAAGRATVSIDNRWENDASLELDETLRLYEEVARGKRLRPLIHVTYPDGYDHESIRRELGFDVATPVPWAGQTHGVTFGIPEVDEMGIRFDVVPS